MMARQLLLYVLKYCQVGKRPILYKVPQGIQELLWDLDDMISKASTELLLQTNYISHQPEEVVGGTGAIKIHRPSNKPLSVQIL